MDTFVAHAFVVIGVVIAGMGMVMWIRGEWTRAGRTVTREEHPVAFIVTVAVMLFIGLAVVGIGLSM